MIYNSKNTVCVSFCLFQWISILLLLYILLKICGSKKELEIHEQKQKEILFCLVFKVLT